MADREAVAKISARESFEALSRDDQEALDRIVRNLCDNPYIDAPIKTAFPAPPAIVTLYDDGEFWVVYHILDNKTIEIWNVGRDPSDPRPQNRLR